MRFATWQHSGATRAGVVTDFGLHPFPEGTTVLHAVDLGLAGALELGERTSATARPTPLSDVRLLPPLTPPSVRDFSAFEEHVVGAVRSVSGRASIPVEWYEAPVFYFANPHALVGAHDDVPVPPGCDLFDFELEVAAVVSGEGRSLSPVEADAHLFGYTILNDWSARDLQAREMRVGLGPTKGKDTSTTLGPWLVTRDELDPWVDKDGFLALELSVAVNGSMIGEDLLSNMGWTFPELISYASRGTLVRTGDLLGSGTCGNGGCLTELWGAHGEQVPPPLAVGDVVEMRVEGIGSVRNRVVAGETLPPVPSARPRRSPLPRRRKPMSGERR